MLHLVDTRLPDLDPDSEQLRDDVVALLDGWLTDDPGHTNDTGLLSEPDAS